MQCESQLCSTMQKTWLPQSLQHSGKVCVFLVTSLIFSSIFEIRLFCDNVIDDFFILGLFSVFYSVELRKKARQLENEIDLKLVSFSKLGTNYSHRDGFRER